MTLASVANRAASDHMRITRRLTAWVISADLWAGHASLGVALGAFALAVAAYVHAQAASGHQRAHVLALIVWPVVTGLPAFVVALALATGLRAGRRPDDRHERGG